MAGKRKQSRKDKRLQKKLQKLEAELPSSDEEGGPDFLTAAAPPSKGTHKHQDTKASGKAKQQAKRKGKALEEEEEEEESGSDSDVASSEEEEEADDENESEEEDESLEGGGAESFDEEEEEDDDNAAASDDDDNTNNNKESGKDGMADVMARILNQEISKKTPVLAKRKSTLMKDMEKDFKEKARAKEAAEKKRAALNHQLHIPDHTDVEKEKGLRRVATRGVVALFNAITKARQTREGGGEGESKTGKGKHGAAKDMSKNDFLQMLKSSTSKTGTGSISKTTSKSDAAGWHREMEGEGEGGPTEASWNAIKDDYLMSAPKLNDFEDSDDEGELEGEGIMSESEGED